MGYVLQQVYVRTNYKTNYFVQGGLFALWLCSPFLEPPQATRRQINKSAGISFFMFLFF